MTSSPSRTIPVTVNGESREIRSGASVADLLGELELGPDRVAVERNRAILPRDRYGETLLAAGDRIEIVHFVGGG
ncbi:MAG: sulfur carrier protein ThiS [Acidobacteriota bacterium]|jgi:thiamine biosynthesis protein ThiS